MLYGQPLNKVGYYVQFYVSLDKALTFSLNSTRLIGTPINVNTFFLDQLTPCHTEFKPP